MKKLLKLFHMLIAGETPKRKGKEVTEGSFGKKQTGKLQASQFTGGV